MERSRIGVLGLTFMTGCAAWAGCALATNGLGTGSTGTGGNGSSSASAGPGASTSAASSSSGATQCTPGTTQPCYTGPSGTEDAGACKGGVWTCASDGSGFGTCTEEVTPEPNDCASGLNLFCEPTTPTCSGALGGGGKAWGEAIGDQGLGIAIDSQGNVVVTGYFHGTLDFGNGPLMTVDGGSDAFVAQYSPSGTLNWVVQLGGAGDDKGTAVTLDENDDVFVVGSFSAQVAFPSSSTVTGGPGIFVAELEPATGKAMWGKGYTGSGQGVHVPQAVALSPDGTTLAVAGYTSGQVTIGPTTISTKNMNDTDGFVFTLTSNGSTVGWVQQINDASTQNLQSLSGVAIGADNNVVVVGQGMGNISFSGSIDAGTSTAGGVGTNVIAAKYSADGTSVIWQQSDGDDNGNTQAANAVALGSNGDVFLAGTFQQQILFGGQPINGPQGSQGNPEVFVAQLDAAHGTLLSGQAFSSTTNNSVAVGQGVAVDGYSVLVGGYFTGALVAGTTTMTTTGTGGRVGFAMKLQLDVTDGGTLLADGGVLWAKPFGNLMAMNEYAAVLGVAFDRRAQNPLGASAVVGYFLNQVDVGLSTGPVDGGSGGPMDTNIFFARLAP